MDAVLDADLSRRSDGDPAGHLRSGRCRRGRRLRPFRPCHLPTVGEPLPGLHAALHPLDGRRFHHRVSRVRRRAGVFNGRARHARHPLRLRRRPTIARRRGRSVGPPGTDPDCDHPDAHAPDQGGAVVSVARTSGSQVLRRRDRLRRFLTEGASVILGVALLIWSLAPVYNMLLIALDRDEGDIEFEGLIWPPDPSLHSFHTVLSQGYWLVDNFWHQLGNSFFIGLMTMCLTVLIGSLASFGFGRMRV